MSIPIAQGQNGFLTIGGLSYRTFQWKLESPRNLQLPTPVGNTWVTAHASGLRTSRLTVNLMCSSGAGDILNLAFWQYFLSRSFSGGTADSLAQTLVMSNGRQTYTLMNAKAESLVLTVQKGSQVGLQCVFIGPYNPSRGDITPSAFAPFDNTPPLMFDEVTFGGVSGDCYGVELTYANNHTPNGALDGTKTLKNWDAGVMSCGATFTFDARFSTQLPFADESALTIGLGSGGGSRLLTLASVVPNTDDNASAKVGPSFVSWACAVQGTTTLAPLSVA